MSRRMIFLDAGHGGINPSNGQYVTPGKRSPKWSDGSQYFEGEGNRLIRQELMKMLSNEGILYEFVSTGWEDVSLTVRAKRVNEMCKLYGSSNCLLMSIHSDGFDNPSAHGWSVYTTPGQTKSDTYAQWLYEEMKVEFPDEKFRVDTSDGDADKEADFYIIKKTNCPAFLSENFFHTNERECKEILMKPEGRKKIAAAHFRVAKRFIEEGK